MLPLLMPPYAMMSPLDCHASYRGATPFDAADCFIAISAPLDIHMLQRLHISRRHAAISHAAVLRRHFAFIRCHAVMPILFIFEASQNTLHTPLRYIRHYFCCRCRAAAVRYDAVTLVTATSLRHILIFADGCRYTPRFRHTIYAIRCARRVAARQIHWLRDVMR